MDFADDDLQIEARVGELIERGLERYGSGDFEGALSEWKHALALEPESERAANYVQYVEEHHELFVGDSASAKEELEQPFALSVDSGDIGELDDYESIEVVEAGSAPETIDDGWNVDEAWISDLIEKSEEILGDKGLHEDASLGELSTALDPSQTEEPGDFELTREIEIGTPPASPDEESFAGIAESIDLSVNEEQEEDVTMERGANFLSDRAQTTEYQSTDDAFADLQLDLDAKEEDATREFDRSRDSWSQAGSIEIDFTDAAVPEAIGSGLDRSESEDVEEAQTQAREPSDRLNVELSLSEIELSPDAVGSPAHRAATVDMRSELYGEDEPTNLLVELSEVGEEDLTKQRMAIGASAEPSDTGAPYSFDDLDLGFGGASPSVPTPPTPIGQIDLLREERKTPPPEESSEKFGLMDIELAPSDVTVGDEEVTQARPIPGVHERETVDLGHPPLGLDLDEPEGLDISVDLEGDETSSGSPAEISVLQQAQDLLASAKQAFADDNRGQASQLVGQLLELSEAEASAQKLTCENESELVKILIGGMGGLADTPELVVDMTEIPLAEIDHRAAFLLTRMGGGLTLEELLDISGMPKLEALSHLSRLHLRGYLRLS